MDFSSLAPSERAYFYNLWSAQAQDIARQEQRLKARIATLAKQRLVRLESLALLRGRLEYERRLLEALSAQHEDDELLQRQRQACEQLEQRAQWEDKECQSQATYPLVKMQLKLELLARKKQLLEEELQHLSLAS